MTYQKIITLGLSLMMCGCASIKAERMDWIKIRWDGEQDKAPPLIYITSHNFPIEKLKKEPWDTIDQIILTPSEYEMATKLISNHACSLERKIPVQNFGVKKGFHAFQGSIYVTQSVNGGEKNICVVEASEACHDYLPTLLQRLKGRGLSQVEESVLRFGRSVCYGRETPLG